MAGVDGHVIGQCHELVVDCFHELMDIGCREVGSADGASEEGIADDGLVGFKMDQRDAAGGVAGGVANFKMLITKGQ